MTSAAFADSSAVVKLYADESDADRVRRRLSLVISQLARVEVPAALWRKNRIGELSTSDTAVLVEAFEADFYGTESEESRFMVMAVTEAVLDHAAQLVGRYDLRPHDGVQLASACEMKRAFGEPVVFLVFDKALGAAAAAEGLRIEP